MEIHLVLVSSPFRPPRAICPTLTKRSCIGRDVSFLHTHTQLRANSRVPIVACAHRTTAYIKPRLVLSTCTVLPTEPLLLLTFHTGTNGKRVYKPICDKRKSYLYSLKKSEVKNKERKFTNPSYRCYRIVFFLFENLFLNTFHNECNWQWFQRILMYRYWYSRSILK